MQIPDTAWSVVDAMHRRFGQTLPATEDGARTFTRMCAEQLRFVDPAGGWCHKSSSQSNPPSKDCLARVYGGKFEGWDILASAGLQGPRQLAPFPPDYHDLAGQFIISVEARNHLNGLPVDPHQPPVTPDPIDPLPLPGPGRPVDDLALVVDAVQGVAAALEDIAGALVQLAKTAEAVRGEGVRVNLSIALGGK